MPQKAPRELVKEVDKLLDLLVFAMAGQGDNGGETTVQMGPRFLATVGSSGEKKKGTKEQCQTEGQPEDKGLILRSW
jgi:hypothetical protein